ncbi:olfactory receptor 14J1-like [Cygnus atratus]|uniref:olfactory receptor 14J1-like n=1 Tax=Cygnus atratus TaxID=8868 RepID=UPI0021B78919|nr:olfactory receptor 14J1-like [Cygnus atratus]
MAYDCYAAICKPLHYESLVGSRACGQMAAAAWGSGFLNAVLHTATTFSLPLCQGNAVDQFFCEIPQILKLSCSDAYLREVGLTAITFFLGVVCFVFIVVSYVQIFRAVLRMPSEQGRHKAFSTCLPHLAVVSLLVSTAMVAYLKPPSISSPSLDLVVSFLYSVVPPAVNPLIYSMRNKELKGAKDLVRQPGKWTTMERGIRYLRELAMLEVIDSNLDNKQLSKDPDEVKCTRPMWQTFVQSAPSSYANSLAVMIWKDQEEPMVDESASQLWHYKESLSSSLWACISSTEKLSHEVQEL